MDAATLRRLILLSLVLLAFAPIVGCGATAWQRQQDVLAGALADLHSPAMDARIAEAR